MANRLLPLYATVRTLCRTLFAYGPVFALVLAGCGGGAGDPGGSDNTDNTPSSGGGSGGGSGVGPNDGPVSVGETLDILVIGSTESRSASDSSVTAFSVDSVAEQLQHILEADGSLSATPNIEFEDIYSSALVTFGSGGSGTVYELRHFRHSLAQYYYWPTGQGRA